jgi:hypothetical protein
MIDLDLNDPIDIVFDRILGRDEFVGNIIHLRECRSGRSRAQCRLAGA